MTAVPPVLAAAQAGDPAAFAAIYREHRDEIHRYIARRIPSPETVEDLVQETFLRAWRRIGTYTWTGRPVGAWLVTIARNLVTDHFKSSRVRLEVTTGNLPEGIGPTHSAEDEVLAELDRAPVRAALDGMRPAWREVLVLEYWAGLTNQEISDRTGCSYGGVKALKYRAATALRQQLGAAA